MTDQPRFPNSAGRNPANRDALEEPVIGLIRDAYLPPVPASQSSQYWELLESRIMSGVRGAGGVVDVRWWSVLGGWAQTGLVAAAAIFALASLISNRLTAGEPQFAYESVMPDAAESLSVPAELILTSDRSTQNDAALSYVLSH